MIDCVIDKRAIAAAQNNADWYAAVFSAHNVKFKKHPFAFVCSDTPPPYYGNVTITDPTDSQTVLAELARMSLRTEGVLSVKDSFCQLELGQNGFDTLFEASWIWHEPQLSTMPEGWHVVQNPVELTQWEHAWKANGSPTAVRMFPCSMLDDPLVRFLGKYVEGRYVAGCIANISGTCVGISNIFAEHPSETTFDDAAKSVASLDCARPIVGYESGASLGFAETHGFEKVGDLRVFITRDAQF